MTAPPTRRPQVGSLFSGVGGFDAGFTSAGFDLAYQCEIDTTAQSILRRHFPNTPLYPDITHVNPKQLPWVDVIIGGWPCQDHSVAGQRKGFHGVKSSLFRDFARIIQAKLPSFVVAENVPGLLSQRQEFSEVIDTFTQLGYLGAWRVLDAQHFGVPQRRRRLFFVAGRGTLGARAAEVLFEPACRPGHPQTRDRTPPDLAGTLGSGAPGRGWPSDTERMTFLPVTVSALQSYPGGADDNDAQGNRLLPVAQTVASDHGRYGKGTESDATDPLIVESISENQRAELRTSEVSTQLSGRGGKIGQGYAAIAIGALPLALRVRRLTPRECERLMGWPDDYTRFAGTGHELSDSQRYRLIGNGVVTPVAAWIARRLLHVLTHEEPLT